MKYKRYFFNRVPNTVLFLAVMMLFFLKIAIYILVESQIIEFSLGGGNDSGYYHNYAVGIVNTAVNTWPVILRFLNDYGLYSRAIISHLLFLLSIVFIPIMTAKLSELNLKKDQKYYFYILFLCLLYPTLFFYSMDVYRDVFMVFSFLLGCIVVKKSLNSNNFLFFIFYLVLAIVIGLFLLGLRPYLGYAFLLSLLLWKIKFTKKRIIFLCVLYALVLFVANYIGIFDRLTEYRSSFEEIGGGSTLGLDFSNSIMFIPNLILSFLGQMLGLYITNPLAVVILLIETLPFFFMLIYVIKNIRLADSFVRFLIIFFVLYASVWLIGNDNLGTAVRLRMYNYLSIYISFFYILKLKSQSLKDNRL